MARFRRPGVVVVDVDGRLKGIITLDDIIRLLGREISGVVDVIENEGPLF